MLDLGPGVNCLFGGPEPQNSMSGAMRRLMSGRIDGMDSARTIDKRALVHDIRAGISDGQLMHKYGLSARELSWLLLQAIAMGIITVSEVCNAHGDSSRVVQLEDYRRARRNGVDFRLPIRKFGEVDDEGTVADICERGLQVTGLSAKPGEVADLEIVTDWCPSNPSLVLAAGCRWSDSGANGLQRAGFEIVCVRQGDLGRLLKDVSPVSLDGGARISGSMLMLEGHTLEQSGISRVRFFRFLDQLPIPCVTVDHVGSIVFVNRCSAAVSPMIFDLQDKPFSTIFADEASAAGAMAAADPETGADRVQAVDVALKIQDTRVRCRVQFHALGRAAEALMLVFLTACTTPGLESPAQADTRGMPRVKDGSAVNEPGSSGSWFDATDLTLESGAATETCAEPCTGLAQVSPSRLSGTEIQQYAVQLKDVVFAEQPASDDEAIAVHESMRYSIATMPGRSRSSRGTDRHLHAVKQQKAHDPWLEWEPRSEVMREVLEKCRMAALSDSIVLLWGESGSGKDHLAHYIHHYSHRAGASYGSINCAAIPHHLAESELFGHEAGAFTGANARKIGLLEHAPGGTLLLNEVGELPLTLQAKLLTFLDTKRFWRVGGQCEVTVDTRILVATNKNLQEEVSRGRFREDLFHRLNVLPIDVPSLRERTEDLPLLIQRLATRICQQLRLDTTPTVDRKTLALLGVYHWPGNVRELRNRLERSLALSGGKKIIFSLMFDGRIDESWPLNVEFRVGSDLNTFTQEVRRRLVLEALKRAKGKRQMAAKLLGITRYSLKRQMTNLGLMANEDQ